MTYDANGNTLNDGMNSYVWDARNRLVSANNAGASFAYDPLGRRAGKTILSTNTNYLYDGANPVQELNGATPTANLLTGGIDERFTRTDASGTLNYLTDALGSTVALTDPAGNSQVQYSYAPYGSMSITGTTTNSYTYTGRETDGLGIDYYRARYYNPAMGRFLSEDPMGFAGSGPNLYAYAGGDPMDFNDPFGMDKGPPPSSWCIGSWCLPGDPPATNNISCTQLAAGQVPDSSSNWGEGALNTAKMFFAWEYGVGNTSTDFGPNSVPSQQMMSAYGLAANVNSFLNGGPSSGFQNFGPPGLMSTGSNPTAQFVGSYGWSMSLSGGYLNITLTNATTPFSFFGHAPGLNPNPPIRPSTGWHPMGRVNQIFHLSVKCGA